MQTRDKRRGFLSVVALFLAFLIVVAFGFILFACAEEDDGESEDPHSYLPQITGITVKTSSYEYDGNAHGIEFVGVVGSDKIYYSVDGDVWTETAFEYTEVGEYTVHFKIVRDGYAEYIDTATLTISPSSTVGVFASDITSVFGSLIVPKFDGLKSGDVVKYSVNDGAFTDNIEAIEVGEYDVSYTVVRIGTESISGTFKLTVLPNINGTYFSYGKRIILTDATAIIDGNEHSMNYGINGRGQIVISGDAVDFSVVDGVLEIGQDKYVRLGEDARLMEMRINGVIYYVERTESTEITLSSIRENSAVAVQVDGKDIIEIDDYNYCESIVGGDNVRHDYIGGIVKFDVAKDFIDITLSLRIFEEIGKIEQSILYDGEAHAIEIEYDNVANWNGGDYEAGLPEYIEVGRHEFIVIVLRDGYLPQPVECVLTILPEVSGTYVSSEGILRIDGLTAELNGYEVEFEIGASGMMVDGNAATLNDDGNIVIDGTEFVKTETKILAVSVGGSVCAIAPPEDQYEIYVIEGGDKTQISIIDSFSDENLFCSEIDGNVTAVFLNDIKLISPFGGIYYISDHEVADVDVSWLIFQVEE